MYVYTFNSQILVQHQSPSMNETDFQSLCYYYNSIWTQDLYFFSEFDTGK